MKIIMTGGTGFLGRQVCKILAESHDVWIISRSEPDRDQFDVRWIKHDLSLDGPIVGVPHNADAVVHFAQSDHFREFPQYGDEIFQVSVGATARLLDWAQRSGVRKFLLGSTGGVYGLSDVPIKESDQIPQPAGELQHYFRTKLLSEALLQSYADSMQSIVLRFFFIYGDGQSSKMLIPRLVDSVKTGKEITLCDPDGLNFNPIHVTDAADLVVSALESDVAGTFNIAGPAVISLRQVCDSISKALEIPADIMVRGALQERLVADISKASGMIGEPRKEIFDYLSKLTTD